MPRWSASGEWESIWSRKKSKGLIFSGKEIPSLSKTLTQLTQEPAQTSKLIRFLRNRCWEKNKSIFYILESMKNFDLAKHQLLI